jgi:hypothetical protein
MSVTYLERLPPDERSQRFRQALGGWHRRTFYEDGEDVDSLRQSNFNLYSDEVVLVGNPGTTRLIDSGHPPPADHRKERIASRQ